MGIFTFLLATFRWIQADDKTDSGIVKLCEAVEKMDFYFLFFLMKLGQCLDIWRKKKTAYTHSQKDQFERSRGLQCDMLTCLMSVRSDKQHSHKCSKGPTVSVPDIYPSHLIDKHFSWAYNLILLLANGWQVCGLWPNTKQPFTFQRMRLFPYDMDDLSD